MNILSSNMALTRERLVFLLMIVIAVIVFLLTSSRILQAEEITVFKDRGCGCCSKWVKHLKDAGFEVNAYNRSNMSSIKKQHGIPRHLQSCHTATINGYVIEGHVPADDIKRLLKEKPKIHGLTVPGMPMGSPGMEGHRKDKYDVLSIDENGATKIYSSY